MSHRWSRRLLAAALMLALMVGTTYVFRNPIATAMFAGATSIAPGVACSHPNIRVDRSLGQIELEPFECTLASGPVRALRTSSPTHISIEGLQAPLISIARARVDKRERDLSRVETNTLGDVAKVVGFSDPLLKSLLDEAEMYDAHPPELRVEALSVFRAGKQENVLYGYRRWLDGEWVRTRAARAETGGPVDARGLDMRATPSRGELQVGLFLGKAERGEKPDTELKVSGRALDAAKPTFELSVLANDERTARAR